MSEAEREGWISRLLTFRGSIGRLKFVLGLIGEALLLLGGMAAGAALNNPTGAGGGAIIIAMLFPLLAFYLHLCLVVARMRNAGVAHPALLGIIVAILPFVWLGLTFEFIGSLWVLVSIGFALLYFGPVLAKSKAVQASQS